MEHQEKPDMPPESVLIPFIRDALSPSFWKNYNGDIPEEKSILWSLLSVTAELTSIDFVLVLSCENEKFIKWECIDEKDVLIYTRRDKINNIQVDDRWFISKDRPRWEEGNKSEICKENISKALISIARESFNEYQTCGGFYQLKDNDDDLTIKNEFQVKYLLLSPITMGNKILIAYLFASESWHPASIGKKKIGADFWAPVMGIALSLACEFYAIGLRVSDLSSRLEKYLEKRKKIYTFENYDELLKGQEELWKEQYEFLRDQEWLTSRAQIIQKKENVGGEVLFQGKNDIIISDYLLCSYSQIQIKCSRSHIQDTIKLLFQGNIKKEGKNIISIKLPSTFDQLREINTINESYLKCINIDINKCPITKNTIDWIYCHNNIQYCKSKNNKNIYGNNISQLLLEWINIRTQIINIKTKYKNNINILLNELHNNIFNKNYNHITLSLSYLTSQCIFNHLFPYLDNNISLMESIDSKWLMIWFCAQMINDGRMQYVIENEIKKPSMQYAIHILDLLSLYTLECLYEISRKNDSDNNILPIRHLLVPFSEGTDQTDIQIEIISEYAYKALGVPRNLLIEDELKNLISPQWILYGSKMAYREHLFHVIDVCLLGHLLIETVLNKSNKNVKPGEWLIGKNTYIEKTDFLKKWYVASLFHDSGYVVQLSTYILEGLQFLDSDPLKKYIKDIKESLEQAAKTFNDPLKIQNLESLVPDLKNILEKLGNERKPLEDHGLVGAFHLAGKLDKLSPDKRYINEFESSISAIAKHELPLAEIDPHEDPLSFLLFLCDKVQEWGRPRIDRLEAARKLLGAMRSDEGLKLKHNFTVKCLQANIKLKKNKDEYYFATHSVGKSNQGLVFLLEHNPYEKTEVEPVPGWIKLMFEFSKCANSKKLPPIVVLSYHPLNSQVSVSYDMRNTPQIDLLFQYANSSIGAYVEPMLKSMRKFKGKYKYPFTAYIPDHPLSYFASVESSSKTLNSTDTYFEQLGFVLNKMHLLPKEAMIECLPNSYYLDFQNWKEKTFNS